MYCKHCGKLIDDDAKFCPECGGIQREISQQSQLPTPPDHTPMLQGSDVSETQPTPTDRLQEEPPEVITHEANELEVESETQTNSGWPSIRTYVMIVVAVVLLIAWALMMRYGGEEVYVGPSELAFKGVESHAGDTIKVAIISEEEAIWVYGTSEEMISQFDQTGNVEYLDDEAFGLNPHERKVVEYKVKSDGKWGVAVMSQHMRLTGDSGADFKIQLIHPRADGHYRYSFPFHYLILIISIQVLIVDFYVHWKQQRIRE